MVATSTLSSQCNVLTAYALFSNSAGILSDSDCLLPNTFYHDFYSTTVPVSQAIRVSMQSSAFDPYILLLDSGGNVLAEDDNGGGIANSSVSIITAAGPLIVAASSANSLELGSYSLSSSADDGQATGCEVIFATRGVSIAQNLTASDCVDDGFNSDVFFIRLIAGIPVTVSVSSTAFDTWLDVFRLGAGLVASNDNISISNTNSSVTYTPTISDYYLISATSLLQGATGAYTLTIAPPAGAMSASSQAAGGGFFPGVTRRAARICPWCTSRGR
jgi:serine protease Do